MIDGRDHPDAVVRFVVHANPVTLYDVGLHAGQGGELVLAELALEDALVHPEWGFQSVLGCQVGAEVVLGGEAVLGHVFVEWDRFLEDVFEADLAPVMLKDILGL